MSAVVSHKEQFEEEVSFIDAAAEGDIYLQHAKEQC